jgi:hypothetical protein
MIIGRTCNSGWCMAMLCFSTYLYISGHHDQASFSQHTQHSCSGRRLWLRSISWFQIWSRNTGSQCPVMRCHSQTRPIGYIGLGKERLAVVCLFQINSCSRMYPPDGRYLNLKAVMQWFRNRSHQEALLLAVQASKASVTICSWSTWDDKASASDLCMKPIC